MHYNFHYFEERDSMVIIADMCIFHHQCITENAASVQFLECFYTVENFDVWINNVGAMTTNTL
jgi:hypothetical protein